MQWRRKRRVLIVIGSANHTLLLKHLTYLGDGVTGADEEGGLALETAPPTTDSRRITFNEGKYRPSTVGQWSAQVLCFPIHIVN